MGKIYQPDISDLETPKDEGDMAQLLSRIFLSRKYSQSFGGGDVPSDTAKYNMAVGDEEDKIRMLNPIDANGYLPKEYTVDALDENIRKMQNLRLYYDNPPPDSKWESPANEHFKQNVNKNLDSMMKYRGFLERKDLRFSDFRNTLEKWKNIKSKDVFGNGYYQPLGDNKSAEMLKVFDNLHLAYDNLEDNYTATEISNLLADYQKANKEKLVLNLLREITNKQESILWNTNTGEYDVPSDWGPSAKIYINDALDKLEHDDIEGAFASINTATQSKASHLSGIIRNIVTPEDSLEIRDEMALKSFKNRDTQRPSMSKLSEGGNKGLANAMGTTKYPPNVAGPFHKNTFSNLERGYANQAANTFKFLFDNTKRVEGGLFGKENFPTGLFGGKEIINPENRNKFDAFVKWHLGEIDVVEKEGGGWEIRDVQNLYAITGADGKTYNMPMSPDEAEEATPVDDVQGTKMEERLGGYDFTDKDAFLGFGGEDIKAAQFRGINSFAELLRLYDDAREYNLDRKSKADDYKAKLFEEKIETLGRDFPKGIKIKTEDFESDSLITSPDDTSKIGKDSDKDIKEIASMAGAGSMSRRINSSKSKWANVAIGRGRLSRGTPPEIDTEAKYIMYELIRQAGKPFGYKIADVDSYAQYIGELSKTNKDIIPFVSPDMYEQLKAQVLQIIEDSKAK